MISLCFFLFKYHVIHFVLSLFKNLRLPFKVYIVWCMETYAMAWFEVKRHIYKFSLPTVWVMGVKLRSSGSEASTLPAETPGWSLFLTLNCPVVYSSFVPHFNVCIFLHFLSNLAHPFPTGAMESLFPPFIFFPMQVFSLIIYWYIFGEDILTSEFTLF